MIEIYSVGGTTRVVIDGVDVTTRTRSVVWKHDGANPPSVILEMTPDRVVVEASGNDSLVVRRMCTVCRGVGREKANDFKLACRGCYGRGYA
jgi:hypothetical protein